MAKQSSQKFIARNRAPRVQIEYDVELYGAEKKIQLPFVMGVLADAVNFARADEAVPELRPPAGVSRVAVCAECSCNIIDVVIV